MHTTISLQKEVACCIHFAGNVTDALRPLPVQVDGFQRRLKGLEAAEERVQALQGQVLQERHALQNCQLALQQEQEVTC